MLCKAGVPIGSLDGDRDTAIAKPVAYGWKCKVEVLLTQDEAKEILDHRNKWGKAAVHYAKQKPEILR
jgi:hypothetical protein